MSTPMDRDCKDCRWGDIHCEHVDCWPVPPGCIHWLPKKPVRKPKKYTKLSKAKREASLKYYYAHRKTINAKRRRNKTSRNAYQRMYRDLDRDAYLLKQKVYNDTGRKK